jgi:hypothetical protein
VSVRAVRSVVGVVIMQRLDIDRQDLVVGRFGSQRDFVVIVERVRVVESVEELDVLPHGRRCTVRVTLLKNNVTRNKHTT